MPIARASVAAGRPHDRLRIRRGEVAAEAQLQRLWIKCRAAGACVVAGVGGIGQSHNTLCKWRNFCTLKANSRAQRRARRVAMSPTHCDFQGQVIFCRCLSAWTRRPSVWSWRRRGGHNVQDL